MRRKRPPTVGQAAQDAVGRAIDFWRPLVWPHWVAVPTGTAEQQAELKPRAEYLTNKLAAVGQKNREAFEKGVEESRQILGRLTERGTDPLYVLSVLIWYPKLMQTELGKPVTLRFKQWYFVLGDPAVSSVSRDIPPVDAESSTHLNVAVCRRPQRPLPGDLSRPIVVVPSGRLAARGTHPAESGLTRAGAARQCPPAVPRRGRHAAITRCLLPGEDEVV